MIGVGIVSGSGPSRLELSNQLIELAKSDDLQGVLQILQSGNVNVNHVRGEEVRSVHGHGSYENFNIQTTNANHQETALHRATENGNLDMVKALIEAGATLDKEINYCYRGSNYLWHRRTPLSIALASGHSDLSIYLMEQGANVKFTIGRNTGNALIGDYWTRSSLSLAISGNCSPNVFRELIRRGADLNERVQSDDVSVGQQCLFVWALLTVIPLMIYCCRQGCSVGKTAEGVNTRKFTLAQYARYRNMKDLQSVLPLLTGQENPTQAGLFQPPRLEKETMAGMQVHVSPSDVPAAPGPT